jgi:hypothetical protein
MMKLTHRARGSIGESAFGIALPALVLGAIALIMIFAILAVS